MGDVNNDLDAFFQKKTKKGKSKSRGVQDIDAIGKRLDRNVKKQEVLDKEEEERQIRSNQQEQTQDGQEESEWHEVVPTEVDLAATGVKDMDLAEQQEQEYVDQVQQEESLENKKTWDLSQGKEKEKEEETVPIPTSNQPLPPSEPKKYVPPSQRMGMGRSTTKAPKLEDDMEFPSLGDADNIQYKEEIAKKKHEHFKKQELVATGKVSGSDVGKENGGTDGFKTQTRKAWGPPPPSESPSAQPKKGSYVPPHLRTNKFDALQDQ